MAEPKTIYCPRCGRKTYVWDGKSTINPIGKCKNCRRVVEYDVFRDEAKFKDTPQRSCGSGVRFY